MALKILIVEDIEMNRTVLRSMLEAADLQVEEAEDGLQGLDLVERHVFDLILMDLRMPGMDGLTAIQKIRARTDAKGAVPIVVVTADMAADLKHRCERAGANGFIAKPVGLDNLFGEIGKVLSAQSPELALL